MESFTPEQLWAAVLAAASAIVLLSNAFSAITKALKAANAPNEEQNRRIGDLEKWRENVDRKLADDKRALEAIQEGDHAIFKALLALLDHGIDGNNIDQMQDAKKDLRNHLIDK